MAIDRLIGADGAVKTATFGTTLVTGTATADAFYKIITTEGDGSVFPTGFVAGDLIQGGSVLAAFDADNTAQLATFTTLADVTSWEITFSKDEVEVTTLVDDIKKYRYGKSDANGTLSGINFISELKKANSMASRFTRIAQGDTAGNSALTVSSINKSTVYFQGYLQEYEGVGESVVFLLGEVELGGWKAGANQGDVQSWESGMRFVGNDPILYILDYETPST